MKRTEESKKAMLSSIADMRSEYGKKGKRVLRKVKRDTFRFESTEVFAYENY